MLKRLRYQETIFTRSLGLVIALMTLFISLNALLWHTLGKCFELQSSVLEFVTSSLQFALVCFVFFLFSSYEMTSKLKRTNTLEHLLTKKGELRRIYLSQFVVLLIPALIICVNVLFWHINAYRLYEVLSSRVLFHSLLSVVLYYLLPECIAILTGMALANNKRAVAYSIIIFVTIMVSPIPLRLFSDQTIGSFSLSSILDWFHLSVPNADWVSDSVYGIPMEFARWILCLFWVFLLLLIIAYNIRKNLQGNRIAVLGFLCLAVLILGARFVYRHNDSIIYKDNRRDGLHNELSAYYADKELPEEEPASFSIEAYKIEICVKNNLKAKVSISIGNRETHDPLRFTLHHGLIIEEICDADGNNLEYNRNIDYLTIDTEEREIVISYSGKMGKYYSNYQAAFLPGYSAFYPIPGVHHLWQNETASIKPVQVDSQTHFDVEVTSGQTFFSNLRSVSANSFTGKSNSVGLFSGLLTLTERENTRYLESLLSNTSTNWTSSDFSQSWKEYQDIFGLTDETIEEKLLIFQPATILGFYSTDRFVDEGSVIYFGDLMPKPKMLAYEMVKSRMRPSSKNQFLYSWFTERILASRGETQNVPEKPNYEDVILIGRDLADYSDEDWAMLGLSMEAFYQLLDYQEKNIGTKRFLNNVYRYLQESEPAENVLDFIYYMEAEND